MIRADEGWKALPADGPTNLPVISGRWLLVLLAAAVLAILIGYLLAPRHVTLQERGNAATPRYGDAS